jgi:hypothetical protein
VTANVLHTRTARACLKAPRVLITLPVHTWTPARRMGSISTEFTPTALRDLIRHNIIETLRRRFRSKKCRTPFEVFGQVYGQPKNNVCASAVRRAMTLERSERARVYRSLLPKTDDGRRGRNERITR